MYFVLTFHNFICSFFTFIRSSDGQLLIVSSSDGFCSIIYFSKEELGVPYMDNVTVEIIEAEDYGVQEDIEEIPNYDTPLKIKQNEEKQTIDISEPPTKKRVQLVTLSSPKNKKCLNK